MTLIEVVLCTGLSSCFFKSRWVMKVKPSVKKICSKCRVIKRHGVVRIICQNPRHKQRQG